MESRSKEWEGGMEAVLDAEKRHLLQHTNTNSSGENGMAASHVSQVLLNGPIDQFLNHTHLSHKTNINNRSGEGGGSKESKMTTCHAARCDCYVYAQRVPATGMGSIKHFLFESQAARSRLRI